ncbi:conjugative relaxase-like TrwC/TraI family protein [Bradyrhizobium japonicum]|uniref:MobF family relaxase n=1 Tax=Bradyrhizobium japonicum TaxID=375 RepID=UPI003390ADB9
MVATIAAGTSATYYTGLTEYYLGNREPAGRWITASGHFGAIDGGQVEQALFEGLHAGVDSKGQLLLSNSGAVARHVGGLDLTLSAPKSVSLVFGLADPETRTKIEQAQWRAAKAVIDYLDRHAAFGRRGRNGHRLEKVSLTVACFQHGESRPAEHEDGRIFSDPNLHTHAVILNLAIRTDGTIGALDARHLFANKMAAGAVYHAALAHELQALGFGITEVGRNGTFELVGVPKSLRKYFSARRRQVEEAMAREGLTTSSAPALAAAITVGTRSSKLDDGPSDRFIIWEERAAMQGIDVPRFVSDLQVHRAPDPDVQEALIAARMAALPEELTAHESLFERRHLYAAVAAALVGTGASNERVEREVEGLVRQRAIIQLGQDPLQQPIYSTPNMIAVERDLLRLTEDLMRRQCGAPDAALVAQLCEGMGLNSDQIAAARAATTEATIAIVEGTAGAGKSTMLAPVVQAYTQSGFRVVGSATAWKIAHQLRDDLGIEARATDSWIARAHFGGSFLDRRTVLIVDEAGLLDSRQMHRLLQEVEQTGAKLILVGERRQLPAVGAGAPLQIVASVLKTTRMDTIVRQRETWAREAVLAFAKGDATRGIKAFHSRGLLAVTAGEAATIGAMVDAWEQSRVPPVSGADLLIAKTNSQVHAINCEVRTRLRQKGLLQQEEIIVPAVTPSGQDQPLHLAVGDHIRFLVRYDVLNIINGTTGVVTAIDNREPEKPVVTARIDKRHLTFGLTELVDDLGRVRLAHGYATTIYGAQGLTTERAFVLLNGTYSRQDIYIAASRARDKTYLYANSRELDAQIKLDLPLNERRKAKISLETELSWLGERLSRAQIKTSTLDPELGFGIRSRDRSRDQSLGYGHR